MNAIFFVSIILKGVGAVLEVMLQISITHVLGVDGYGTYSTWINAADLLFWTLCSGLIKCNTYYLSGNGVSIQKFKKRYYLWYTIPVLSALAAVMSQIQGFHYWLIPIITGLELIVLDRSSVLIAQQQANASLIGEYILGRVILVIGVFGLNVAGKLDLNTLLMVYIGQYVCVIVYYVVIHRRPGVEQTDISDRVSVRKWGAYQSADIMQSLISQMPVILQYFFSGAFEAGVVSIVLLLKKLINFISGPTAKVFLPEFSRLYRGEKKTEIRECFATIMRMQMLFIGPMAVILIGFPNVVLHILADELLEYSDLFRLCSAIFLVAATLGPCGGLMQMTGNEKTDNRFRWIAILGMVAVMFLSSRDRLFVLYGLCAQTTIEAVGKYLYVCHWMEEPPVGIAQYARWWGIPAIGIFLSYMMKLQNSLAAMTCIAGLVFAIGVIQEFQNDSDQIRNILRRWKR